MRSLRVWFIRTPSRNGRALCEPNGTRAYVESRPPEMATTRASLVPHARMSPPSAVTLFTCVVSAAEGPPGRVGIERPQPGRRPEQPDRAARLRDLATPLVQRVVADQVAGRERLADQVVLEDRVVSRRRGEQAVAVDRDLVTVLQVGVAERSLHPKRRVVHEDLVARGQVHAVAAKRDAAQAAIGSAPLPADRRVVPVEHLFDVARREVDEVDASVALALVTRTHDGTEHDSWQRRRRRFHHVKSVRGARRGGGA